MYQITASLAGFKTAVADNIQVMVGQTVTVDFSLEVGQVSDQVTVMAETPLLESSTPEIGIGTTEKEVHTWPIMVEDGTRQLQTFIFTSMPGTEGGGFAGSINGGQSYSHEILIDGISIGRMDLNGGSNSEFTPTIDAVSEFKLQTGALSSQYGNTQTAMTNFGMKSGRTRTMAAPSGSTTSLPTMPTPGRTTRRVSTRAVQRRITTAGQ